MPTLDVGAMRTWAKKVPGSRESFNKEEILWQRRRRLRRKLPKRKSGNDAARLAASLIFFGRKAAATLVVEAFSSFTGAILSVGYTPRLLAVRVVAAPAAGAAS